METEFGSKKMGQSEWTKWADDMIRRHDAEDAKKKIQCPKNGKALFLPFQGEFGHLIAHYIRMVHFSEATEKVVCIKKGYEVLFPSATSFEYDDWQEIPDELKIGTDRHMRDYPDLVRKYIDHTPIQAGGLSFQQEDNCYSPSVRIPFKPKELTLSVDVCIGTRNRKFLPEKNWKHGQQLADTLTAKGYTFAVIGTRETSYSLDGQTCMSGDFGDVDAAIELIRKSSLYVGQDSGGAHLASTVGSNMVVLDVPDTKACTTRKFFDRMRLVNPKEFRMTRIPADRWNDINFIIETVLDQLPPKPVQVKADLERKPEPVQVQPVKKNRKGK